MYEPSVRSVSITVFGYSSVAAIVTMPQVTGWVSSVIVVEFTTGADVDIVCDGLLQIGLGSLRGLVLCFSVAIRVLDGLLLRSTFLHILGGVGGSALVTNWV